MFDALGPVRPDGLFIAAQLLERREQRPRLAVPQAQVPAAAPNRGLERDPCLAHTVGRNGRLCNLPPARLRAAKRVLEHVPHTGPPLNSNDVPRERNQIPPIALLAKQLGGGGAISPRQDLIETRQPLLDLRHDRWGCGS